MMISQHSQQKQRTSPGSRDALDELVVTAFYLASDLADSAQHLPVAESAATLHLARQLNGWARTSGVILINAGQIGKP
jgi:hypothetical protein